MSRGVLMYAHNNSEIDYFKIACANALMVKRNLQVPVSLVTDTGTLKWAMSEMGESFVNTCFDKIISVDKNSQFRNMRNYADTANSVKSLQFYNANHWQAYDLTPYDETLFIDCDYLIMSSALDNCWGSVHDVMINHHIYNPFDDAAPHSKTIDNMGIRLYWATVIYFRKSSLAEHLFAITRSVQENYSYYKDLYCFTSSMFRNDNAFSIAVHTLNGYNQNEVAIVELPIPGLLMAWDTCDIQNVNGVNDITVYADKPTNKGQYILSRFRNTDIHIMNKWAVGRFSDRLIELYK